MRRGGEGNGREGGTSRVFASALQSRWPWVATRLLVGVKTPPMTWPTKKF